MINLSSRNELSERLFYSFALQFCKGGPAQNIAEKIIFPTKKSSKI